MMLKIRVKTSANNSELKEMGDYFIAKLKSAPENNAANLELIKIVSKKYGVDYRRVKIKSGFTSKHKLLEVDI